MNRPNLDELKKLCDEGAGLMVRQGVGDYIFIPNDQTIQSCVTYIEHLEAQLQTAKRALEHYANDATWGWLPAKSGGMDVAQAALKEIDENNH